MRMEKYDLIIAGAGLAGLALARELKDSGLRVLALDARSGARALNYHSSGTFMEPGEFGLPQQVFHELKKIRYCSKNNETIRKIKGAYIIDRAGLYEFLEKEAFENAAFRITYGAKITGVSADPKGYLTGINYACEGKICSAEGSMFADCTGLAAKLGIAGGLAPVKPVMAAGIECLQKMNNSQDTAHFFVGSNIAGCYGWIFPKGGGLAITGLGTIRREQYGNLKRLYDEMRYHWKLSGILAGEPLEKIIAALRTGTPLKRLVNKNLLILGDSALQANPLIGEGIRFILYAAKSAARAVIKVKKSGNLKALAGYERDWVSKYYPKFRTAYMMQRFLKWATRHDWILDKGVQVLKVISGDDFRRVISADISVGFFIRIFFEAVWKIKILKLL
jgi:digeranylgeranylglycerophospholipid reductase